MKLLHFANDVSEYIVLSTGEELDGDYREEGFELQDSYELIPRGGSGDGFAVTGIFKWDLELPTDRILRPDY